MFPLPHLLGCFQNSSILVAALHKSAGSHRNGPTALSPAHTASRSSPLSLPSLWGLAGPATSLPFPFLPDKAQLGQGWEGDAVEAMANEQSRHIHPYSMDFPDTSQQEAPSIASYSDLSLWNSHKPFPT